MSTRAICNSLIVTATLICLARSGRAQTDADKLFADATELAAQGKYAEACPKFEESQKIDAALGTQFNLALCYEKLGKLGSAFRNYEQVQRLAHATGKKAREDAAQERMITLRARVGHLVIRSPSTDVTIKVDGDAVENVEWRFYAVDPGEHVVYASASAKKPWQATVTLTDTPGAEVLVDVPALAVAAGRTITVEKDKTNVRRITGFVVGGIGVVGVGVAMTTGIFILNAQSTANSDCTIVTPTTPQGQLTCATQAGRDAVALGKTLLPVNAIAWAVGAAALAGGGLLLLTSFGKGSVKATVTPTIGVGGAGVSLAATF